jgi:hypothetical protein
MTLDPFRVRWWGDTPPTKDEKREAVIEHLKALGYEHAKGKVWTTVCHITGDLYEISVLVTID